MRAPGQFVNVLHHDSGRRSDRRLYNSAAGTYELDGSSLRYNRIVSIGPARMLPENQPYVRQLVTLTSNRLETATTNSAGVTTILKYARVE